MYYLKIGNRRVNPASVTHIDVLTFLVLGGYNPSIDYSRRLWSFIHELIELNRRYGYAE